MPEMTGALLLGDATVYRRGPNWQLETYPSGAVVFRDIRGVLAFGIHPDDVAWVANKLLALAAGMETASA